MQNVAVLISGGGTNLQALIDAQGRGEIADGRLRLVVSSDPKASALKRAEDAGIAAAAEDRSRHSAGSFDKALLEILQSHKIDVVVLAGFMCILGHEFLSHYPNRVINVHPSLIPSFCGRGFYGLKVHKAALDYGVKVTGATVHFVNEIPDGGRIILQKAVDVLNGDTPETLQRRVMEQAEWVILPKALAMLCRELESGRT